VGTSVALNHFSQPKFALFVASIRSFNKIKTGSRQAAFLMMAAIALFAVPAQAQGVYGFTGVTAVGSTSAVANIPVTFASTGTITTIRVLTSGVAQMDYANTGSGSCATGAS